MRIAGHHRHRTSREQSGDEYEREQYGKGDPDPVMTSAMGAGHDEMPF